MANFNLYYIATIIIIACGSIPKGYDEGGFSASVGLASFKRDFGLIPSLWEDNPSGLADRKANISSFGVLGAAFGSILALAITDRLGRLRSWQCFVILWASGILMQVFSSGILGLMLFARIWGGLGAGGLTVVAPLYLSEIAPAKSRGMVVSIYMVILLTVLTIGFFVNYAVNATLPSTRLQYRLVQGIVLAPVGIAFIGSLFLSDTPRWLASRDRGEDALVALSKLRGAPADDPSLAQEFEEIHEQLRDKQRILADTSMLAIFKEIATTSTYRKRFLLGALMQTVAQWSGGNGITYYIPEIFRYAGVVGENTSLITSGAYGVVKLVFTMVFTWGLVDVFGRRRCFCVGLLLQCVTHIYMAVYMGVWIDSQNKAASDAAIASVFIYAVGWSIGLCTVQYLYGTEIYPTRIRSACYATNMALHWFFQFAVVRVTPNMFVSLDIWGAYVFWACVCAVGLVVLGLLAPETKGIPMERMEELFSGPWYMGWRATVDLNDRETRPLAAGDDSSEKGDAGLAASSPATSSHGVANGLEPAGERAAAGLAHLAFTARERGTFGIVSNSLITLSLCVWTVLHLNLPDQSEGKWQVRMRKPKWLFGGLVFPEYIACIALTQKMAAMVGQERILESFYEHGLQDAPPKLKKPIGGLALWASRLTKGKAPNDDQDIEGPPAAERPKADARTPRHGRRHPWTLTHTYYVQMGGFVCNISHLNHSQDGASFMSKPGKDEKLALTVDAVILLAKTDPTLIPDLSEADILAKNRADALSRLIAMCQAAWFFIQFVGRVAMGLPATVLELHVVAHIFFALLAYAFWWAKPLDILVPTEISITTPEHARLVAAMYARSRIGYMRRVDGFKFFSNHHVGLLDIASPKARAPEIKKGIVRKPVRTSTIVSTDKTVEASAADGPRAKETPDVSTALLHQEESSDSFQLGLKEQKHGVRMVAHTHRIPGATGKAAVLFRSSRFTIVGRHIVFNSDGRVPGPPGSKANADVRVTIPDSLRHIFQLAAECQHLHALGVGSPEADGSFNETHFRRAFQKNPWRPQLPPEYFVESLSKVGAEGLDYNTRSVVYGSFFFSSVFNAVPHLLAWNGPFRTRVELLLWRISSAALLAPLAPIALWIGVVAAGVPLVLALILLFSPVAGILLLCPPKYHPQRIYADTIAPAQARIREYFMRQRFADDEEYSRPPRVGKTFGVVLLALPAVALVVLTLFARLFILAECFINLAYAPRGVFEIPDWSALIPHIS